MATPSEAFAEEIAAANATDEAPENEAETPAVVETPAAESAIEVAPLPTQQSGPRVASFDDLTPDLPDLPPTRRGAPLRLLLDDRKTAIQQAIDAGTAKNAAEAQVMVLQKTVETLLKRFGEPPPAPIAEPPPPETSIDALRRKTDPATFQYDPEGVLAATLDAAEERSLGHLSETERKLKAEYDAKLAELRSGLDEINSERTTQRTINAYRTAFPDRDPATDKDLDHIGFYIDSVNAAAKSAGQLPPLPVDDPQSYRKAAAWLDSVVASRTPPPPPQQVRQPVAAAPSLVAPPPAPPVGSGAPIAARPPVDASALPQHDRAALESMLNIFPQLRGKKDLVDEITGEVAANAAAGISPYSRRNMKRSATA